jgi:hypothetical protein
MMAIELQVFRHPSHCPAAVRGLDEYVVRRESHTAGVVLARNLHGAGTTERPGSTESPSEDLKGGV